MCGRFVSSSPPDQIAQYFGAEAPTEKALEPSYNVAPTNDIYVVLESGGIRRVEPMHWGLVPSWAKDLKIGNKLINARAETVAEKPSFRSAFKRRRCIIPVDGFYEWVKVAGQKKKQPYFISRPDGDPYAFAGLWETWRPSKDSDDEVHSCTIITGSPNEKMAEIHHRMPIMLPPDTWEPWLDPDNTDVEEVGRFLVPAPVSLITFHPVSLEVNNPRNKSEHLSDEVEAAILPVDDGDGDGGGEVAPA
jgi:putative SOS response-associated peptidase YedK